MDEQLTPLFVLFTGDALIGKNPGIGFTIRLGVTRINKEERTYAILAAGGKDGIGLTDLISFLKPDFDKATLPDILNSLPRIRSFSILYGSGAQSKEFVLELDTVLKISEAELNIRLSYDSRSGADKKVTALGGVLSIGNHRFRISFLNATIKGQTQSYLFAQYDYTTDAVINLKDIAQKLLPSIISDAPDISIDVKIKGLTAFLLYSKNATSTNILFGMGAGVDFSLNNLPLVGEAMEKEKSFGITRILLTISQGSFGEEALKELNKTLPVLPTDPVPKEKHFGIFTLVKLGEAENYYSLIPESGSAASDTEAPVPVKDNYTPLPGSVSGKAKWIKAEKQLGPLSLQRIGIGYIDKKLVLLLDAGITVSLLSVQLKGLGLGFQLKWRIQRPDFYIDGLGISFKKDPIEISGLLIRVAPKDNEEFSFYGAARISTSKFSIAGIGAYSKLKKKKEEIEGQISFFIYAMYAGPIGGPAFFFVTGIAAGFGYNRRIRVPAIQEVRDFPLVAMALNPDPKKTPDSIVGDLIEKNWIPSSPGDYWLAIGIRFNSFKLIDSFVLVTVQFGSRLEFALLGLSILKWPAEGTSIAYVELAILVRFGQGSDVIAVDAMITHNSYIIDKNCRLTGGFAFYAWVSGEHEGDFVITLGGYHPRFKVPAHYPKVERLALTWKLSDLLSIHGEMYYALTPTAIMAGGRWEVEYNLSFLRASLILWADMIISWAPFYYEINAGIRVRIEARIKILFIRIYFSLEMGAELRIWGPPFAGEVYVDWTIFSFTIPFGAGRKEAPQSLSWNEFTTSFIPAKKSETGLLKTASAPQPLETRITAGIIGQCTYKDENNKIVTANLVNPYSLRLTTETLIPVTGFQTKKDNNLVPIGKDTLMETGDGDVFATYEQRNKEMGIKSMAVDQLESNLQAWIEKKNGNSWTVQEMGITCTAKGVADALWGRPEKTPAGQVPEAKIIKRAMSGVRFYPEETSESKSFTEKNLDKDIQFQKTTGTPRISYPVNTDALDNDKSETEIKRIIRTSINKEEKRKVAEALDAMGFNIYTKEQLTADPFSKDKDIEWLQIPYLAVPGGNIPVI